MTMSMSELDGEFRRIHGTWEYAGIESRKAKINELYAMLEQLWKYQGSEAADLRRRVSSMIDDGNHLLEVDRERRQTSQHIGLQW